MGVDLRDVEFALGLLEKCFEMEVDLSMCFAKLQYDQVEEWKKCRMLREDVKGLLEDGLDKIWVGGNQNES